jgi:hypothetical protein
MDDERELDYLIAEKFLKLPKVYVEEWGKEVYKGHDGFCDNVLLRNLPHFSSEYSANRILIRFMQVHGSSLNLSWDEESNQWTCSWITGGIRFNGIADTLEMAVSRVAHKVAVKYGNETAGQ